ncbi:MAG: hypothetical protein ACRCSQ_00610 [Bacteroidales bacterium]
MASIKSLKKEISSMADEMAMASLLSKAEITDNDILKVNEVLSEIYDFEDMYREKAHLYPKDKSAKEIRKHFKVLFQEIYESAQNIIEKIKQLN